MIAGLPKKDSLPFLGRLFILKKKVVIEKQNQFSILKEIGEGEDSKMKSKKLKAFISALFVSLMLAGVVQAATLGTLSYWYSDASSIGRWKTQPAVWASVMDSNSFNTSDFASWVNHAMSQWSYVRSSYGVDDKSSANIKIYGGEYDTLKAIEPRLGDSSSHGGTFVSNTYEGDWVYSSTTKTGNKVTGASAYIWEKLFKGNDAYKNTVTHEFGHAIGWAGHSSSSSDVMYTSNTSIITLTTRDKNHLKQVY